MSSGESPSRRRAAVLTLGCARNEVDSDEMAGRLDAGGWELVDLGADPDVVVVNTCGFVEQAKKDSIDAVLAVSGGDAKIVAVGCLAERYGAELAAALPEADAVLGFDSYPGLAERLAEVVDGRQVPAHTPRDRRTLLPISPVQRGDAADAVAIPGHGWVPDVSRRRLGSGPVAPLKLASGCDRRCSFCAIPAFRGAFVSRPPEEVLAEAAWLADQGVRELLLVSENSTSYGKDLGDRRALDRLLPGLAAVPGIARVRVSYLQPAEVRPELLEVIAGSEGVAPYFDLSFQHASQPLLRRMRRFGSRSAFVELCGRIRALAPEAGIRSNVIVGFPGETAEDLDELELFLAEARLDAVGVFGYSDEDGTAAAGFPDKLAASEIRARVERVSTLVDELTAQRAEDRIGSPVRVLVDVVGDAGDTKTVGRAEHQAPEVDGESTVASGPPGVRPGDVVDAIVVGSSGVDLLVEPWSPGRQA